MNIIQKVIESIEHANNGVTRLNDKALNIKGMSSLKVRNFLNKIVSYPDSSYLEIGVWHGSTFYSALYNNQPRYALAIDNFSQFSGDETIFKQNMSDVGVEFSFLNNDSFNLIVKPDKKFNVYFYDGNHSFGSQKLALTYYYEILENEFIYICDDWDWQEVKEGTMEGVKEKNIEIIQQWELPGTDWWNGLWVAAMKKNQLLFHQ